MFNFLITLIIASQLIGPLNGIVDKMNQNLDLGFPKRRLTESFEPIIESQSAVVLDVVSNKILYQKDAYKVRPIASLTKLMTAIVFLEQGHDWEKYVQITQDDKTNGGKVQIMPGEIVRLEDVFNAALVGSANNAAYELARATDLEYTEFVQKMNDRSREIGMKDTKFVEPTGLDSANESTAIDAAIMLKYAMQKEEIRQTLSSAEYSFYSISGAKYYIKNTNELLDSYLNPIGGKTGYIEEAGFCLANFVQTDKVKAGIVTVILGAESREGRFQDNKFITQWVLNNWEWE
ncbi:MAG: serine hydrolase [Candidatus Kuenenbacteria bacterium]